MGDQTWGGTAVARHRYDARPVVFPELRADLVRFDAARGRAHQVQVVRALARAHARVGTAVELGRLRQGVQMSVRISHEPREQMRRLVVVFLHALVPRLGHAYAYNKFNISNIYVFLLSYCRRYGNTDVVRVHRVFGYYTVTSMRSTEPFVALFSWHYSTSANTTTNPNQSTKH